MHAAATAAAPAPAAAAATEPEAAAAATEPEAAAAATAAAAAAAEQRDEGSPKRFKAANWLCLKRKENK